MDDACVIYELPVRVWWTAKMAEQQLSSKRSHSSLRQAITRADIPEASSRSQGDSILG
jgi:hypothetical protein